MNTDTVELVYHEAENPHLCVPLSSLGLSWRAQTAQLSLALCYWWGGGGWYYLQSTSWGWTAPDHETHVPQPVLGRAVQVAPVCSTATDVLGHTEGVQCTGISAGLCLSSETKRRQAAPDVLHARDYVPHPPRKATAKLSPEHLGRVEQNQLSMGWGWIQSKPQSQHDPAGNPCCSTHPGTTASTGQHRAQSPLRPCWELCSSSYCIPPSPAVSVLPGGTAGAICSGTNTQQVALWRKQWVSWTGCAQWQECKLSRGILTLSPSAPLYIYIN